MVQVWNGSMAHGADDLHHGKVGERGARIFWVHFPENLYLCTHWVSCTLGQSHMGEDTRTKYRRSKCVTV